eukprot:TRINITY_DN13081_c0_g1_i1.p1 TRINITY_DN13081_c0_g1~~TRINITY_DN13081_c0_g1_i1.p1  ORF type:complete len:149 (+),score=10.11 TRINITY_DN13081_c0_g1_i1:222-668(+)
MGCGASSATPVVENKPENPTTQQSAVETSAVPSISRELTQTAPQPAGTATMSLDSMPPSRQTSFRSVSSGSPVPSRTSAGFTGLGIVVTAATPPPLSPRSDSSTEITPMPVVIPEQKFVIRFGVKQEVSDTAQILAIQPMHEGADMGD